MQTILPPSGNTIKILGKPKSTEHDTFLPYPIFLALQRALT